MAISSRLPKSLTIMACALINSLLLGLAEPQIQISSIENNSNTTLLCLKGKYSKIIPPKTKQRLSPSLSIPFVSIESYHQFFTLDQPYIPDQAIIFQTDLGSYGVWRNEKGIVCAQEYKQWEVSPDE
ncbi:MAG TPA: hypothetical protein VHA52_02410, partial [Candidatus Babeliaceae bacterium]|nr:hypothetical protein [Candidatus Babeliaceae bacterium]